MHAKPFTVKSPDGPLKRVRTDQMVFNLLKRAISKLKSTSIDGLWKVMEEKWKSIPLEILRKALISRKTQ